MSARLNVNLNDECALALREVVEQDGVTATEMVRRAILAYKFLRDERAKGNTVVVGTGGKAREVVFL